MKTSDKIKTLRIEQGLSQEELGAMVGVQKAAINKYETGRVVNIKRSVLQKLADALSVSPADLLDDEEIKLDFHLFDEHPLMSQFNQLNEEGQEKLLDYAKDLVASGRYKKHNISEVVEEA